MAANRNQGPKEDDLSTVAEPVDAKDLMLGVGD
jgi:hypothetical protein